MDRFLFIWKAKGIGATLLCCLPLLILLQLWRPLFFLTDDSFSLSFPVWVSIGNSLWSGENPFVSAYLFGGNYPLYRDSAMIPLFHPVTMPLSFLAPTFLRNAIVDIYAIINVLLAAAGFRWLLANLQAAGLLRLSSGYAVFLSLSYSFSMYSLLLGSSGFWYLANVAALPWLIGALWEKKMHWFWLVTICAAFHNAVAGYPSCFIYSMLLLGSFALMKIIWDRDPRLGLHLAGALFVAAILSSPMILPSLFTLAQSTRGSAIPVEIASEHQMPIPVILSSIFFGGGSMFFGTFELFGKSIHAYGLASFAASWLVIASFFRHRRYWGSWDVFLIGLFILCLLLVSRPIWLGNLIYNTPILQGMRWPHKEIFLIVFLLHLWIARGCGLVPKRRNQLAFVGVILFLATLCLAGPPSLNEHAASKKLLLSGEADRYWAQIKKEVSADGQIVPIVPDECLDDISCVLRLPLILTGAANFPAMYGVKSWSGYSATMPKDIFDRKPTAGNVVGMYRKSDTEQVLKLQNPVLIEIEQNDPLVISLSKLGEQKQIIYPEK